MNGAGHVTLYGSPDHPLPLLTIMSLTASCSTSLTPHLLVASQAPKYMQTSITMSANVLTENFGRHRFAISWWVVMTTKQYSVCLRRRPKPEPTTSDCPERPITGTLPGNRPTDAAGYAA